INADRRSAIARDVFTAGCLIASPLLLFWPMRADLFANTGMIDPFLSTAVVQNGRDLVDRFDGSRQVSRAGLTVPGRITNEIFGDVGGYYVHHYLLVLVAIVPAFVVFARLRGRAAGAVAGACVLASPVLAREWSNDYGTAAAVSYLLAGYCC